MKPDLKGLTKLAQHIRRVPKKQFDIHTWLTEDPTCGTAGCIAGWATMIFPRRFKKVFTWKDLNDSKYYSIKHIASDKREEEAFARGFHISEEDAEELTLGGCRAKRTPRQAANSIMKLVAKLKK